MLSKANTKRIIAICLMIVMALFFVACNEGQSKDKEITIFVASSLTDAVTDITEMLESSNEGTTIRINFAGSKTLRTQLENGAHADIFISANEKHYNELLEQNILVKGRKILTNEMVLVVSNEASEMIKTLEDLKRPHRLILGDKGVPVGDYSREIICGLGKKYGDDYEETVLENLVSSESNVRRVLMKVVLGEGDAAIVYKTDITEDMIDKITVIDIPSEYNVTASYWIGLVNNDVISESVRECCTYFSNDKCCEVFESYGFDIVK